MSGFSAEAPMMLYYQRHDAPGAHNNSNVSTRDLAVKVPPGLTPKPTPKELHIPMVDAALYMRRRNPSSKALGTFRRLQLPCLQFYFTSDFLNGAIPMVITIILIISNMALVWHQVGWCEYIFTLCMLATTFTMHFLTMSIDPGIYPRLCSGEKDPLEGHTQLVFCKECQLRRPPRCAHCYQCNVCVLEHDHHCSILGGCVGIRNLRWFTLYLLFCCSSTMIGVVWLARYLFNDLFINDEENQTRLNEPLTPYPTMQGGRRSFATSDHSGSHLAAIVVLLLDGIVVMLVGLMLCIYVYLTLSSTTRRESMRKQNSLKVLLNPQKVWQNLKKVLSPPPSLLDSNDHADEEVTNLV
ncbi:hypothetical protein, conserved [Leishmania tarentolae]|uniref:Palmitoyltransferase n=1 Tax=Leishmania tarentolae TaxID=5689 RepID=A0A640KR44_LEITA|nr:hypothetical protein, conserved [Leishmania tarentolae]